MDEKILSSFRWFCKIDADGIPFVLFINGEAFIRCRCCKVHKSPCDTYTMATKPARICKECHSKATASSQYEKKGKERKRSRLVIRFCADCSKPTKSRNWQPRHNCCKECFQARRHAKKTLPECRYCGQPVKTKRGTFCSVKCMTDSKKKRHQVSCIQCQKLMEVLENRFKARSYFLCSTECANDFHLKRRIVATERNEQKRLVKRKEREKKKESFESRWLRKSGQCRSRIRRRQHDEWERKCHTASTGIKNRTASVNHNSPLTSLDWESCVAVERNRINAVIKRSMKSGWELKSENISSTLRKRQREGV